MPSRRVVALAGSVWLSAQVAWAPLAQAQKARTGTEKTWTSLDSRGA